MNKEFLKRVLICFIIFAILIILFFTYEIASMLVDYKCTTKNDFYAEHTGLCEKVWE